MITKQGLKLMIIFQVWLDKKISKVAIEKTKSSQREINKKKKTSKRSVFVLNILKLDDFMSLIKNLCQMLSNLV